MARLNAEQKLKQIEQVTVIQDLTKQIEELVKDMESPSCKKAFEYSTKGLNKKCEQFSQSSSSGGRFQISDEEKEFIKKIREGKAKISEISTDGENADIPAEPEQHDGKKKGRKIN